MKFHPQQCLAHASTHTYAHTYIHAYIQTHIHAYTHIHSYTHTHTFTHPQLQLTPAVNLKLTISKKSIPSKMIHVFGDRAARSMSFASWSCIHATDCWAKFRWKRVLYAQQIVEQDWGEGREQRAKHVANRFLRRQERALRVWTWGLLLCLHH
jgi:hypothetical protein